MRDKLIELFKGFSYECCRPCDKLTTDSCNKCAYEQLADYLLENGVIVPPCKVGDKMYKLCSVNSSIKKGQMWDGKIVETNCDRCGYKNCSCYDIGLRERNNELFIDVIKETTINSLEFLVKIMPYVGTIWFTTKEEAEQALRKEDEGK